MQRAIFLCSKYRNRLFRLLPQARETPKEFSTKIGSIGMYSRLEFSDPKIELGPRSKISNTSLGDVISITETNINPSLSKLLTTASTLIQMDITQEQYFQYKYQFIQIGELIREKIEHLEGSDLELVYKYGVLFQIDDQAFWESLELVTIDRIDNLKLEGIINLLVMIKKYGFGSQSAVTNLIEGVFKGIDSLTPEELSIFTMLYPTMSTRGNIYIYIYIDPVRDNIIECTLIENIERFTHSELGVILTAMCNHLLPFPNFLERLIPHIESEAAHIPNAILVRIIYTYNLITPQHRNILIYLLPRITEELPYLSKSELLIVLQTYSAQNSVIQIPSNFYITLDKLIGKNIRYIEGSEIAPLLSAFVDSGVWRNKLFLLFQMHIKRCIGDISPLDLCTILKCYTLARVDSEYIYDLLEPYIISQVYGMEVKGLVNALFAYENIRPNRNIAENIRKNYRIVDVIGEMLTNQTGEMNLEDCVLVAFNSQGGGEYSATLINKVRQRIINLLEEGSEVNAEMLTKLCETGTYISIHLEYFQVLQTYILDHIDNLTYPQLKEIITVLFLVKNRSTQFEDLRIQLTHKLNSIQ